MNTVKEFVENMVKIDFVEQSNCYGHYPFQLYAETEDGRMEFNSLALGGDVLGCYNRVKHYRALKSKKIFMSVDFPAGGDIEHDFVCVFSIVGNKIEIYAIPYNEKDGTIYPEVHESNLLDDIMKEFKSIVS